MIHIPQVSDKYAPELIAFAYSNYFVCSRMLVRVIFINKYRVLNETRGAVSKWHLAQLEFTVLT